MKLLENTRFEALNCALTFKIERNHQIFTRIESYSCKMAGNEKQMYKRFISVEGVTPHDLQALSPPQTFLGTSAAQEYLSRSAPGDERGAMALCDTINGKTLFYLTTALNSTFNQEYNFSGTRSEEFNKENLPRVKNEVEKHLNATANDSYHQHRDELWEAINAEISSESEDCEIYSYNSDNESDPFAEEGCVQSFNYLFYNKKLKRIVVFTNRRFNMGCISDSGVASDFAVEDDDEDC